MYTYVCVNIYIYIYTHKYIHIRARTTYPIRMACTVDIARAKDVA